MGNLVGRLREPLQNCSGTVASAFSRKRRRSEDSQAPSEKSSQGDDHSPKKKKLLTTAQYIYHALFKEQKNSDIAVLALGKVWNLHKVYLSQSPYFYCMFNGSWKESTQDFIHVQIVDENITLESLEAVLGSLYSDEIEFDNEQLISILATATLFHLDGVIKECEATMIENTRLETVVAYYEAACQYGAPELRKFTFRWLETNLLSISMGRRNDLRQISIELMTALIESPDLYVIQTEFSLYSLLRTWIYLRLHPDFDYDKHFASTANAGSHWLMGNSTSNGNNGPAEGPANAVEASVIDGFFTARSKQQSFLLTAEGKQFVKPFQALRTQYLTNHHMDLRIVLADNIIPKEWLSMHVLNHWQSILKVDHMQEDGPQNLDVEEFNRNCMRCGRILLEPGYHKWRWTGFNFGLDLILIADSRVLSIRRHHRNEHERLLSLQTRRQFMIRASICSINKRRHPVYTQKSEVVSLNLEKNEEVALMVMDTQLVHPLLISVNILVATPHSQTFKENILLSNDETSAIPISEFGTNCDRATTPIPGADDSAICVVPETPPNADDNGASAAAASHPSVYRSASTPGTPSIRSTASTTSSQEYNEFFID